MKEKERIPFQSFGEIAANPQGELFLQLPTQLLGSLSTALQFAYSALLRAWNDLTQTDAPRREILKLVNEARAEKGRGPITNLRTVTWYYSVLKELGVISRKHDREKDVWITESTMPVRSQFPDDPPKPATESRLLNPEVATTEEAAKSESEIREEDARSLVQYFTDMKWFVPLNDKDEPVLNVNGQLDWKAAPGATEPNILWKFVRKRDAEIQALIARDPDIRALIGHNRPARK
jgi:hypothetical protein